MYDHPSIEALSAVVQEAVLGAAETAPGAASDPSEAHWAAVEEDLDALSQDDMAELLASKLASLENDGAGVP